MFVSSNLSSPSFPQGSLLNESCVVSVTVPCLATTFLSKGDFSMVDRPSSKLRNHFQVSWQSNARVPKLTTRLTQKSKHRRLFKVYCLYLLMPDNHGKKAGEPSSLWHSLTKEKILAEFETSEKGLSSGEAKKRLEKYGKNTLKEVNKLNLFKILIEQFKSFIIYILIIAGAISFLIQHYLDGIVIFAVVILNASIGFFQQYRAEKAIISLKKLIIPKSRIIREGKHIIVSSEELVPGDIIVLEAGDKINADCRIIQSSNLQANEAILTGESLPIDKSSSVLSAGTIFSKRENMLYTGTQVVRGEALAVIIATAMETEFGKIAETLQEIETPDTPMQKRLNKFSTQIGYIILILVAGIMLLGLTEHFDLFEMFLTSIALAVSAIPAGLPAVLSISFAVGSFAMSSRNVIVRRLPAVETLGSVTVICSDKTGTITEEKMHVEKIFAGKNSFVRTGKEIYLGKKKINYKSDKGLFYTLKTSVLCNNARFEEIKKGDYEIIGDPTEQALLSNALDLGLNKKILTEEEPSVRKIEFESKRKLMSIVRENGRHNTIYSKGAPEKILDICSSELYNGEIIPLTGKRKKAIYLELRKMEQDALRVLGFAFKSFSKKAKIEEKGLIFLGLIGMLDPPRKEVRDAIMHCKSAGISVKMITGDSAITASAIASKIGITGEIITEEELEKMSDSQLSSRIDKIVIFARTTPHQKLRITEILQKRGEIVAITGDGVNDVLALKSADIGVAMGQRGTDVARDVSDIVLTDDNFASVVEGVREGRKNYDNIKKFTKYFLAVNFSEIFLVAITLFMGLPLPLLPLQLLWMNLVTDSFPALSLAFEKEERVMKSKPRTEKSILDGIWKFIIFAGFLALVSEIAVFFIGHYGNYDLSRTRTLVLTTAILFELFFVYTCRSKKPLLRIGIFSNKWMNYAVLVSLLLHLLLIYTPAGKLFSLVPLSLMEWMFILPFAISGLVIFEIAKYIRTKNGDIIEDDD